MELTLPTITLAKIKNGTYIATFLASIEFIGITEMSVFVLTSFILLDIITGILKSGSIYGWKAVKSSTLQRGVIAKCLVILIPIIIALTGKGVGLELSIFAQSIINVLILSEAYSVIGNIYAVRTGNDKSEFDAVAFVISRVKNVLKKIIVDDNKI